MEYAQPLIKGRLIKRYKRFLADVELLEGEQAGELVTVHCPNTGSMKRCAEPGWPVWLWDSAPSDPKGKRKYRYSWEWVAVDEQHRACINTNRANTLVAEALEQGVISELQQYQHIKREPKVEDGRLDFLLSADGLDDAWVEVKNVTLLEADANGLGTFPDAVTERGLKHLKRLLALKQQGHRAVLLFCVAHEGIEQVAPAAAIDPKYAQALAEVAAQGVEVLAYNVDFSAQGMCIKGSIPVRLAQS